MSVMAMVVFSSLFVLVFAELMPKPKKSVEQEFGDAIAKFLSKGVKVRIEKDDK